MRRVVVTYGLIAGAIMSVFLFVAMQFQDAIGFDRGAIVGYTSMVVAFLMVFVGTRTYRDLQPGGRVGFGKAFQVALLITLLASACYVLTWEIVYDFFMPDFMEKYAAHAVEQARAAGQSAAQVAALSRQMTEFAQSYRNPLVRIGYSFLEPLPVGLLFSIVSAWLVSRRPRATATGPLAA